jgi:uncharacterized protein (DUF1810 family)
LPKKLLNVFPAQNIDLILGFPGNLKFRSSMTLFAAAASTEPVFQAALDTIFVASLDPMTLQLTQKSAADS